MAIKGIESARLKFEHAERHLQALTKSVTDFADGHPCHCTVAWERNHPEYICHVVVKEASTVPDLVALQASDYIGNLRAALDHAVYTHVVEHCAKNGIALSLRDERNVKFPIIESEKKIQDQTWFSAPVLDVLEKHQPGLLPDPLDHPLAQLNRLVNHDKHRLMLVTNSAFIESDVVYSDEFEFVRDDSPPDGELRPGYELAAWVFRATVPQLTRHPHHLIKIGQIGYHISIDLPDSNRFEHLLPTMNNIRDRVGQVLDDLEAAGVT
ncbi:hypothetical protein IU443_29675 [Nocardia farcinica]|uniref:hypothetical protein n=1 Tax=Nocardia farcinica TaxID=37329 RepID=UPI0018961F71|nr:hypothetical protein [Nocardia farcinica]MBF6394101.1 hypothetical protein [Nocardia farcinica]